MSTQAREITFTILTIYTCVAWPHQGHSQGSTAITTVRPQRLFIVSKLKLCPHEAPTSPTSAPRPPSTFCLCEGDSSGDLGEADSLRPVLLGLPSQHSRCRAPLWCSSSQLIFHQLDSCFPAGDSDTENRQPTKCAWPRGFLHTTLRYT